MSEVPLPGPLDEFLANPPASPPHADLRHDLLARTTLIIHQRRRRRRAILAAASLAAASLLIALGVWALSRPGTEVRPTPDGPASSPEVVAKAKPGVGPLEDHVPKTPPPVTTLPSSPLALEWRAFDAPPETQWVLYREAGDRYFEDANDLASALRCYTQAFRSAPTSVLAIHRDDNWMVMALKRDQIERRKEN